jgi:putative transposase
MVAKNQTRWTGFDDRILSMYARGMTTREIQGHLEEMYKVEVSPALISQITDEVMEEVKLWQSRPLEPLYPIVYLDALYVKMRHEGRVENRAVHVVIGVSMEGSKEVLGLWTSANEGAKFWLSILNELRVRGVKDILIACVDGLKGFPQAIESVFPNAEVQLCIVHLVRASLNYVNWKDRKQVVADLKPIYRAATAEQARQELDRFVEKWGKKYPAIGRLWNEQWERVIPFFAYTPEIRKVIYTTNAVESLHMSLRKAIKTRGSFPSEDSALKLLYLALRNASAKWQTVQGWREALNQFEILHGDRVRAALARAA